MIETKEYYIGEVSKLLGISQRTIRYYEELGFIKPGRSEGRFRIYARSEFNRLRSILHLKELGMTLEEIGALVKIVNSGSVHDVSPRLREALMNKKKEFEAKLLKYRDGIKELEGVLSVIRVCEKCRKSVDADTCQHCLDERSKDLTPLIKGIL
jgi:DNA-binding transcriptional MerR regulator